MVEHVLQYAAILVFGIVVAVVGVNARDWLLAAGWPLVWAAAAATVVAFCGALPALWACMRLAKWAGKHCND